MQLEAAKHVMFSTCLVGVRDIQNEGRVQPPGQGGSEPYPCKESLGVL